MHEFYPTKKTYEQLTNRRQKFVDLMVDGMSRSEAYLAAGFSGSPHTCRANARKLFFELQFILHDRIQTRIEDGGILGLKVIKELMLNSKSDAVRLAAAKDSLARAGYDVPIEQVFTVKEERSDEDIKAELDDLLTKAGLKTSEERDSVH